MRQTNPDNRRAMRKFFRKQGMDCPVYQAWNEGQAFAHYGNSMPPRLRRNPYPKGRRYDEWNRGYNAEIGSLIDRRRL